MYVCMYVFILKKKIVSRIAIVKPEKARAVEDYVLGMARSGRLTSKISETQIIDILEQMNETKKETKIVVCI